MSLWYCVAMLIASSGKERKELVVCCHLTCIIACRRSWLTVIGESPPDRRPGASCASKGHRLSTYTRGSQPLTPKPSPAFAQSSPPSNLLPHVGSNNLLELCHLNESSQVFRTIAYPLGISYLIRGAQRKSLSLHHRQRKVNLRKRGI